MRGVKGKNYCLVQGDCLNVLDNLVSKGFKADAVITDPPYGISYQSCWKKNKEERFNKIKNDEEPFVYFIGKLRGILKPTSSIHIFTRWDVQQSFIDEMNKHGLKCKNVIIWDKVIHGMGDLKTAYGSKYESILFSSGKDFRFQNKRPTDIIKSTRVPASKLTHPNEKPVELLEVLIKDCVPEGGCS